VTRGAFQGAEGMVTDLRKTCKVVLSLSATRQCFSLEVDLTAIEVLERRDTGDSGDGSRQLAFSV